MANTIGLCAGLQNKCRPLLDNRWNCRTTTVNAVAVLCIVAVLLDVVVTVLCVAMVLVDVVVAVLCVVAVLNLSLFLPRLLPFLDTCLC